MDKRTHHNAPNRAQVRRMARVGTPEHQICVKINVSLKALRKFYTKELLEAPIDLNLEVLETLARMATSGKNTAATIFWVKTRCQIDPDLPSAHQPRGPGFRIEKSQKVLIIRGPDGEHERVPIP